MVRHDGSNLSKMESTWFTIHFLSQSGRNCQTVHVRVNNGDNILQVINRKLKEYDSDPRPKKRRKILSIQVAPRCEACRLGLGGQRDHMECQDGCLREDDSSFHRDVS